MHGAYGLNNPMKHSSILGFGDVWGFLNTGHINAGSQVWKSKTCLSFGKIKKCLSFGNHYCTVWSLRGKLWWTWIDCHAFLYLLFGNLIIKCNLTMARFFLIEFTHFWITAWWLSPITHTHTDHLNLLRREEIGWKKSCTTKRMVAALFIVG